MNAFGKLHIVPTPIGNLKDITYRAVEVLKDVDLILAEDTRTSKKLLKHYGIETQMSPYHIYNEHKVLSSLLNQLIDGIQFALISDAGTPGISDPGYMLVRECIKNDIKVECLPGATALIPALVLSGLPSDRFVFEGFLPHKKGRKARLKLLSKESRTIIVYESPHRLNKCMDELLVYFGAERKMTLSRELSKLYEEIYRGSIQTMIEIQKSATLKGEYVLIIDGHRQ